MKHRIRDALALLAFAAITIAVITYARSVYREAAAADKYDPRTAAHRSHP